MEVIWFLLGYAVGSEPAASAAPAVAKASDPLYPLYVLAFVTTLLLGFAVGSRYLMGGDR